MQHHDVVQAAAIIARAIQTKKTENKRNAEPKAEAAAGAGAAARKVQATKPKKSALTTPNAKEPKGDGTTPPKKGNTKKVKTDEETDEVNKNADTLKTKEPKHGMKTKGPTIESKEVWCITHEYRGRRWRARTGRTSRSFSYEKDGDSEKARKEAEAYLHRKQF